MATLTEIVKAPKITVKDQYIQDIKLNRGTYTFSAWVFVMGSNYSIGLKTQSGTWLNFDMKDQVKALEWRYVKQTLTIYDPCVQFSLMNSFASTSAYVIVAVPMLEEGTNAGTHKPNDLDLDESIGDGAYTMFLSNQYYNFQGSTTAALPGSMTTDIMVYREGSRVMPSEITVNTGSLPAGMTSEVFLSTARIRFTVTSQMVTPTGNVHISFVVDGKTFSLWFGYGISFRGADGVSKDVRLEASTQIIRKLKNGSYIPPSPVEVKGVAVNTTITTWEYSVNGGSFSTDPPTGVTRSENIVSINPGSVIQYALYTIRVSDGTISDTLSVARLEDGTDGASGEPGITLLLSNESHVFAGGKTSALAGSTNTTILAFKGVNQIAPTSVIVDDSYLPVGMTGSVNGSVVSFIVTSQMTSSSGVIPIVVVVDGKTFTVQFSYAIAFTGQDGTPGTPGLSKGIYLNAATQIIKYNEAGTPTPSTNFTVVGTAVNTTITTWEYSVNGGDFTSTLPAGVTRSGNTVTVSPSTVTFNTLSIRAGDGTISDTTTIAALRDGTNGLPGKMPITIDWVQGDTHYNNDTVVSYVYYRAGNTWWRLKDAYTERTATASPSTTYYQQLSSVEYLVTKIIIAEQGNLAGLIFKDGKLISQKGTINGEASVDYGNPDFTPNVFIDGDNGEIKANKLLNPFVVADPDIPGDLQAKLTNNHNVYLEASGSITYNWTTHYLPGTGTLSDRNLDGLNLKIYAPYGCNRRVKLIPAAPNAVIFTEDPGYSVSAIKITPDTRERIHLSAEWDRVNEALNWVITSRTGYRILDNAQTNGERRVPNVFKEGDIIAKGYISSAGNISSIENRLHQQMSFSVSSNIMKIRIPRQQYFNTSGSLVNRTVSANQYDLKVEYAGGANYRNVMVTKEDGVVDGIDGVHFKIEFRTYNGSSATAEPFKFTLRALDYVFNNTYLDDTI